MKNPFSIRRAEGARFMAAAMLASFGAYFCVYAFRKPFAAAQYADAQDVGPLDFKIAIIIAQVLGYALSKFAGIKLIAEMTPRSRPYMLLGFVLASGLALAGFGYARDHYASLLFLFLNGLMLGMLWGIVFSYLEGRRATEVLGAVLCSSFILSSGAVKSVGSWLMRAHAIPEYWMPAATALLFLGPLLLFTLLLEALPPPSPADEASRTERRPMDGPARRQFFSRFQGGLLLLIVCYMLVTAYRDFRDNFAAELWDALGYADASFIFTWSEAPIALAVLALMAAARQVTSNARAFLLYHAIIVAGCLLVGLATLAFQQGRLRPDWWMMLVGAGLYMAYVPFNGLLFDRMIAAFRSAATAGFLIYVADAWGYIGSVSVLLYRNFGQSRLQWLEFFTLFSYGIAVLGAAAAVASWLYFARKLKTS